MIDRDFFEFCVVMLLILFIILAAVLVPFEYFANRSCRIYSETTGMQTKRAVFDECYIEYQGQFILRDEYKAIIVAREGLKS